MIRNTVHTMTRKTIQIPLADLFDSIEFDPTNYRIDHHNVVGNLDFGRANVRDGYIELILREVHPDETRK